MDLLARFLEELRAASTAAELQVALERVCIELELPRFAYQAYRRSPGSAGEPYGLTTYPQTWVDRYIDQRYDLLDPVIGQAASSLVPFGWSAEDRPKELTRPQRRFLDEACDFDLRTGITIPIHHGMGRATSLTLGAPEGSAAASAILENHQHLVHLIAIYLHQNARRILDPTPKQVRPHLSPREHACLTWTCKGKSIPEVADILEIGKRTVRFHLENAKEKLGVGTVQQAIVEAIRQGIIDPMPI